MWPCMYFFADFLTNTVTVNINRDLKQTTTATATRTPQNKRFNEQNNSCARAL